MSEENKNSAFVLNPNSATQKNENENKNAPVLATVVLDPTVDPVSE